MDNFNPLSIQLRGYTYPMRKFLGTTKKDAFSADFGVKYYFCGRPRLDFYTFRQQNEKSIIWLEIEHLQ